LGIALFPAAFWKIRETLSPYLTKVLLLQTHKTPIPIGPAIFENDNGQKLSFSDFKGKHLLVNVWATWCPPCRKEMPSLDRLQAILSPQAEPEIVAISVDDVSFDQLQAFYSVLGIRNLNLFKGNQDEILNSLRIGGLPTTLFIDHAGEEMARLIGPTTWDAPEMVNQLKSLATKTSK
jgi:thiol-disulfide isomerase/thioredoxin